MIKIYCWCNTWHISTRGTAFAESDVNGFGITFKELVLKALSCSNEQFQNMCNFNFDPNVTYICEFTSVENRVVKAYRGYNLFFLTARNNYSGGFENNWAEACEDIGMRLPNQYSFNDVESCIETAKHLKDLDEGYVLYQDGIPCAKIKSPVYVAVHNIRGEGLSPKRIAQIVLSGESAEYLKYFPEDESFFIPYFDAQESLQIALQTVYDATKHIEDQKAFAMEVKDEPFSAVLFQCKRHMKPPFAVFEEQREEAKIRMLEAFL